LRCYGCFRPQETCHCAAIPTIDNQTDVLILQHARERFHPFNTARLVHKALTRSTLLIDHTPGFATGLPLKPGAGLLYPGPEAMPISQLRRDERPEQLVILDGTWHHAKTMLRDTPALRALPRYRLDPDAPSRFRIRREPTATALSTVEAVVAALRVLEPETAGLEQLLAAFLLMIDRQVTHPKSVSGGRQNRRRIRNCGNIPRVILGDLENVVVAYGESSPGERGSKQSARLPVCWVAERLATGESFGCVVQPEFPLTQSFLDHWELTSQDFSNALSFEELQTAWAAFERPTDTFVVYNQGAARLLDCIRSAAAPCLLLKGIGADPGRRYATLDELLTAEGIVVAPPRQRGRAGKRLANAVALVRHFNAQFGNDSARSERG
jgi:DTW domain-containing protein YfiP